MKKLISLFAIITMAGSLFACNGNMPSGSNSDASLGASKKVVVYYFHFTRRCMTCQNVEDVSKKAIETLYAGKVKTGEVKFQSVNLDEKEGEAIGAKYKIEGQTLIVISGDKRIDLTDKGFLYANNSPEKLQKEIKKAVDSLMK